MTTPLPVQQHERSEILDSLRGFALLGIFMANSAAFSLYMFLPPEKMEALPTAFADKILTYLHFAFIDGKFYSLFSLLFGIGFSIILSRSQKTSSNALAIFYRRLVVLAIIGLLHTFLLWDGDILLVYAVCGMFLPLFRNCNDRALITWWAALILSPVLLDAIIVISNGAWRPAAFIADFAQQMDARNGINPDNFSTWLVDHTDYKSVHEFLQGGFFWRWEYLISSNRLPKVVGMFVLGLYVGRNMIYANLETYHERLKQIQRWGFVIGIPASLAYAWFELDAYHLPKPAALLDTVFYALSVVPLSLAYTSTFCILWLKPDWKKRLMIFAPAGRMALTNYILQTLIGITIYYGIGFGMGAKFGPALFFPIAIAVFTIQILISKLWLSYFRFGPLEWIWRMLTYGKVMPLRKD
ncbi:MAG: DUF418 domain-containing protein [Cyclobacteriaceae bacterium]|nr:DUF418 domain-containing protein [Cyclobacteriaceae bacterium]